jgi:hypothetical protein
MAQTASSIASVTKDAWTSERLVKQFEDKNAPLGRLESVKGTMIGTQAQVPIYNNRSGAYTSVGAAGGSLNPAQAQQVSQATYTLVYSWFQTELETSALAQAGGGMQSLIAAKDLEIEGGLENVKHQMTRQLVTNGDGIVAATGTSGGASTTVPLTAAASEGTRYGYSALKRGWLFPGATVDVGTTADTDALVTASTISAVSMSTTAPTITIGSAIDATAGTHFVYIPNPNSTTAANPELNGLRQIAATSGALGGLNPSTAGQEFWQAAVRDTSTTVFSPRSGAQPDASGPPERCERGRPRGVDLVQAADELLLAAAEPGPLHRRRWPRCRERRRRQVERLEHQGVRRRA